MSDEDIAEYMKDEEPLEPPKPKKKRPDKFRTKEELEEYLRDDEEKAWMKDDTQEQKSADQLFRETKKSKHYRGAKDLEKNYHDNVEVKREKGWKEWDEDEFNR